MLSFRNFDFKKYNSIFKVEEIDFTQVDDFVFEFICFELIQLNGYEKVTWRKGGADSGRDIEAFLTIHNPLIETYEEKWFFECKHYKKGVPPEELNSKIAWADSEKPSHLVFFISSYLSNQARTWLEKIAKDKPYKIHLLEGDAVKRLIINHPTLLLMYFGGDQKKAFLFEAKRNWLTTYGIYPSYSYYRWMVVQSKLDDLTKDDLAFLFCTFLFNYEVYLSEIIINAHENEELFKLLIPYLRRYADSNELLFNPETPIHFQKCVGLTEWIDNIDSVGENFFIAGEAWFHEPNSAGLYAFYRISDQEFIEVRITKDSSFKTEISYITKLANWDLMYLMWVFGYSREFSSKVFDLHLIKDATND